MASVVVHATSIGEVDPLGSSAAWAPVGGTLAEAFGSGSNGTTLYGTCVVDLIGLGYDSTKRLEFTGFDAALAVIPNGSLVNSIEVSAQWRRSAIGDTMFIPTSTGAGSSTHQLRLFNPTSGGANQTTYAGTQNCRSNVLTNLGTSYGAITRTLSAATDGAGTSSRFGTFFSSLANLKTGLVVALGAVNDEGLFDVTTVDAYGMSLTVDYTAPASGRMVLGRRRSGSFRTRRFS